ncbi:hypothetical protein [Micromonospora sp. NPDC005087]|uniref:hypothetical protein n=1 Tax=Micromonospora sp. NPDC005087 TaxID=3364225 RepID=UPI0036757B68
MASVGVVASVAVVADRLDPPARPAPADPVAVALQLAHDLETQNRYDAVAQMYQEALRDRPTMGSGCGSPSRCCGPATAAARNEPPERSWPASRIPPTACWCWGWRSGTAGRPRRSRRCGVSWPSHRPIRPAAEIKRLLGAGQSTGR